MKLPPMPLITQYRFVFYSHLFHWRPHPFALLASVLMRPSAAAHSSPGRHPFPAGEGTAGMEGSMAPPPPDPVFGVPNAGFAPSWDLTAGTQGWAPQAQAVAAGRQRPRAHRAWLAWPGLARRPRCASSHSWLGQPRRRQ